MPPAASSGRSTRSTCRSRTSATSSSGCGRSSWRGASLVGGLAALVEEYRQNTVIDLELACRVDVLDDRIADDDRPSPGDRQRSRSATSFAIRGRRRRPSSSRRGPPMERRSSFGSRTTGSASIRRGVAKLGHQGLANTRDRAERDRRHGRRSTASRARDPADRPGPEPSDPDEEPCRGRDRARTTPADACSSSTTTRSSGRDSSPCSGAAPSSRSSPRPAPSRRRSRPLAGSEPNLVVMDVRLPDGSGIEACREIRAELPGHARRHADELSGRGRRPVGDRRRRERLPPQAGPRARPGRGPRGRRTRRVAARSRGDRAGPRAGPADRDRRPAGRARPADAAGAEDPAARRRGQDQQGDRRGGLPVGQDRQELRQLDPRRSSTSSDARRRPRTWRAAGARAARPEGHSQPSAWPSWLRSNRSRIVGGARSIASATCQTNACIATSVASWIGTARAPRNH